jgi:hypothetical protein
MSIGKGGGQGVGRPPDQEIEDAFATAQRKASVDVWRPRLSNKETRHFAFTKVIYL